jgi:hypothetical protein
MESIRHNWLNASNCTQRKYLTYFPIFHPGLRKKLAGGGGVDILSLCKDAVGGFFQTSTIICLTKSFDVAIVVNLFTELTVTVPLVLSVTEMYLYHYKVFCQQRIALIKD